MKNSLRVEGSLKRWPDLPAYFEVLKPRETAFLVFIGGFGAILAASGFPPVQRLILAVIAVTLGSAGANALTNYADRDIDARMERTKRRALPSHRIHPAERMLPLAIFLVVTGIALAGMANPAAALVGIIGTIAALLFRKTVLSFLMGGICGAAPVLVGWLMVNPVLNATAWLLVALMMVWLPLHAWAVIAAYQDQYLLVGAYPVPTKWPMRRILASLSVFAALLYATSLAIYFLGGFGWFYLVSAVLMGLCVVTSALRLTGRPSQKEAWRLFRLSSYPYLGVIFAAMAADLWLRALL